MTLAEFPDDDDLLGSTLELIEQPRRKRREQRRAARMQQHGELAGLEGNVARKILKPLAAETSLALRGSYFSPALLLI
jgi:hypothetical protein